MHRHAPWQHPTVTWVLWRFAPPSEAPLVEAFCHAPSVAWSRYASLVASSSKLSEDDEYLLDGVRGILCRHFLLPLLPDLLWRLLIYGVMLVFAGTMSFTLPLSPATHSHVLSRHFDGRRAFRMHATAIIIVPPGLSVWTGSEAMTTASDALL